MITVIIITMSMMKMIIILCSNDKECYNYDDDNEGNIIMMKMGSG